LAGKKLKKDNKMPYKGQLNENPTPNYIDKLGNLSPETFAVGVSDFIGEIFYVSVMGYHGITNGRFWANDYTNRHMDNHNEKNAYIPEFDVRVLQPEESILIKFNKK
jgi:hypothetical protein